MVGQPCDDRPSLTGSGDAFPISLFNTVLNKTQTQQAGVAMDPLSRPGKSKRKVVAKDPSSTVSLPSDSQP